MNIRAALAAFGVLPFRVSGLGNRAVALAAGTLWLAAMQVLADQVVMQNGDCYYGKVLSLSPAALVLQSGVLGKVTVPRGQVKWIYLGTVSPATNSAAAAAAGGPQPAGTNAVPRVSPDLRELAAQTNLIQQVQMQLLGTAGPEANQKFSQLMDGLISGKMTLGDLRNEAQTAADQLRSLKKELGPEAGDAMDGYLTVLDHFLKETAASGGASTNAPAEGSIPGAAVGKGSQ